MIMVLDHGKGLEKMGNRWGTAGEPLGNAGGTEVFFWGTSYFRYKKAWVFMCLRDLSVRPTGSFYNIKKDL